MAKYFALVFPVLCIAFGFQLANAEDWPQWRGPDRNGMWNESGIIKKFPTDGLKIKWRTEIGSGYTGPTVAAGRVYLMDRLTKPERVERVLCFDAQSGELIWKHEYACRYQIGYTAGPRASVTIDNGKAFAHGAMGNVICFDAENGEIVWEKDLNKEYSIQSRQRSENRMPIWGMTCSPLLFENKFILQIGAKDAGVIALDRETGEEIWTALDDRGQYSSPILIKQGQQDVVLAWTGESISGISPTDGKVFWSIPWQPRNMPIGCASPIVKDNHVFCTSFYDGSMLLKLDPEKPAAEKVWHQIGPNERQTKALHSMISTPLWIDDHIYGVDSYGQFRCLNAKTGERVWEDLTAVPKARWSNIHFVKNGSQIWMFNERGELIISELSPTGFKEISRTLLIEPTTGQLKQRGGVCWSHPAFAMKSVFIRNDKELLCADLAE